MSNKTRQQVDGAVHPMAENERMNDLVTSFPLNFGAGFRGES